MTARDTSDPPPADFRGRLLALRGRAGLTQRALAALVGLSGRAIAAWETGGSYPSAQALQALIALYLQRGVFTPGQEHAEAVALWEAARDEAPRLKTAFDLETGLLVKQTQLRLAQDLEARAQRLWGEIYSGTGAQRTKARALAVPNRREKV